MLTSLYLYNYSDNRGSTCARRGSNRFLPHLMWRRMDSKLQIWSASPVHKKQICIPRCRGKTARRDKKRGGIHIPVKDWAIKRLIVIIVIPHLFCARTKRNVKQRKDKWIIWELTVSWYRAYSLVLCSGNFRWWFPFRAIWWKIAKWTFRPSWIWRCDGLNSSQNA